ncbi:MAG TPA: F0F1 ATP synthase subunit A [Herpetosiphonaceae bacterium]|nr:F0F1 ATP synthase subunit A [Herpetosiphonaceae bacterium]
MSTKQKVWISVALVAVVGIALRFTLPVGKPLVSVRAEELFHIGGYTVTNSLLLTWLVMLLLVVLSLIATSKLRRGDETALRQPRGLQNTMEYAVETFYNTMSGVSPKYAARFFVVVATIFFLVLPSNWLGLVPGVGSVGICFTGGAHASADAALVASAGASDSAAPVLAATEGEGYSHNCPAGTAFHPFLRSGSADLNLTLALALVSFLTTEFWGFRKQGLGYLGKFFIFNQGPIQFFVGIIELISEFARIISFTFRLFGNIFAGEVVLLVMAFLFPTLLSLPFYGLELFVGLVQAFVFAMLTMAFIDMAAESHGDHGHEEHAH